MKSKPCSHIWQRKQRGSTEPYQPFACLLWRAKPFDQAALFLPYLYIPSSTMKQSVVGACFFVPLLHFKEHRGTLTTEGLAAAVACLNEACLQGKVAHKASRDPLEPFMSNFPEVLRAVQGKVEGLGFSSPGKYRTRTGCPCSCWIE